MNLKNERKLNERNTVFSHVLRVIRRLLFRELLEDYIIKLFKK